MINGPTTVEIGDLQKSLARDIQHMIEKHDGLPIQDQLAIASQIVGMIAAKMPVGTAPFVMAAVIQQNIELGNAVMTQPPSNEVN